MRKYTSILLFLFVMVSLSAQTVPDLETQINFDLSLKDLVILIETDQSSEIDRDQYIVLEGVVSAREVLFSDEENFAAKLELSYGEWEGLERVSMYKCDIQLEGLQFAPMIPARRSRTPNPEEITLNSRLLIFGKYLGYREDEEGNKFPVVAGLKVRRL